MSKLTLSVDKSVVARAKSYAKRKGVSISQMVEAYLAAVADPSAPPDPPVLKMVRGTLKSGSRESYRKHLVEKYR
jgi:hypothetical protein